MDIEAVFPYFFGLMFAAIVITLVVGMIKHGGLKGAVFGARIEDTVGEVGVSRGGGRMTLRVHLLGGSVESNIGLELAQKTMASYSMIPVSLSRDETRQLIGLLEAALARTASHRSSPGSSFPHSQA